MARDRNPKQRTRRDPTPAVVTTLCIIAFGVAVLGIWRSTGFGRDQPLDGTIIVGGTVQGVRGGEALVESDGRGGPAVPRLLVVPFPEQSPPPLAGEFVMVHWDSLQPSRSFIGSGGSRGGQGVLQQLGRVGTVLVAVMLFGLAIAAARFHWRRR